MASSHTGSYESHLENGSDTMFTKAIGSYLENVPDRKTGLFGEKFGGSFVPPHIQDEMDKLSTAYLKLAEDPDFLREVASIRKVRFYFFCGGCLFPFILLDL